MAEQDDPPGSSEGPPCPECGCTRWWVIPQGVEACYRMIALLDAIILLDSLALRPDDAGRLAHAVRDDLSALPALLDALEEAGMGEERRVVGVLCDNSAVA